MSAAFWVGIGVLAVRLTMLASESAQLTPKVVHETGFRVVGISTRTTNAEEMSGKGVIAKQWDRFMKERLLSKIPNKIDSDILVVYTDYESDANGAYTYIIGARVTSVDDVPPGMVAKKVPAGRYAVFTSEKGIVGKVVPEAWSRIWALPKSAPGGNRAYQADFEVYDQPSADPQNAQVDIYVGLNSRRAAFAGTRSSS